MVISWIVSICYIRRHYSELNFPFFSLRFEGVQLRAIIRIGLPIGLNNSLYSMGHVAMQTLVNSQGSIFMAGQAVAGRITGMANIAASGLSAAATTFSGQNYGAGNLNRLRQGTRRIPVFTGLICLSSGLLFWLFHDRCCGCLPQRRMCFSQKSFGLYSTGKNGRGISPGSAGAPRCSKGGMGQRPWHHF